MPQTVSLQKNTRIPWQSYQKKIVEDYKHSVIQNYFNPTMLMYVPNFNSKFHKYKKKVLNKFLLTLKNNVLDHEKCGTVDKKYQQQFKILTDIFQQDSNQANLLFQMKTQKRKFINVINQIENNLLMFLMSQYHQNSVTYLIKHRIISHFMAQ